MICIALKGSDFSILPKPDFLNETLKDKLLNSDNAIQSLRLSQSQNILLSFPKSFHSQSVHEIDCHELLYFQESKVTQMLKECLGSFTCQATMLAHVTPEPRLDSSDIFTNLEFRIHEFSKKYIYCDFIFNKKTEHKKNCCGPMKSLLSFFELLKLSKISGKNW